MLAPLSRLYGKIINVRNSFYAKNRLKSFSLDVPTISVGNITVGGTGKTPIVAFIAELLAEKGEKVCVISRGYKRENENKRILVSNGKEILADVREAGDEPLELAGKLLGKAFVIADANRVEAGIWAKEKFGITAFVLDDAFQHLRVKRDLDIVAVDATNPFGNEKTLPAGILREPLENLGRADLMIITRANLNEKIEDLKTKIRIYNQNCPVFTASNKISDFFELNDFFSKSTANKKTFYSVKPTSRSLAFCALGNPNNFFEQLKQENFNIVQTKTFPDHHFYSQTDIRKLELSAETQNAEILITTAKDAVKLKNLKFRIPCYVARSKLIFDDEKKLRKLIYAVLNNQ